MKELNPDTLRKMYWEQGWSLKTIGDIYGLTTGQVHYQFLKHEIPRRKSIIRTKASREKTRASVDMELARKSGAKNFKHNESASPNHNATRLYRIWLHMKSRCYGVNDPNYKYYGAKGITVCKPWREDYLAFKEWAINSGYQDDLTIDRINNNKGYYPQNCQWLSRVENARKAVRGRLEKDQLEEFVNEKASEMSDVIRLYRPPKGEMKDSIIDNGINADFVRAILEEYDKLKDKRRG